jgi:phosphoenolpyruvate-protein kinase (PTS system EI component)
MVLFFLGIGIRHLSVDAEHLHPIARFIADQDLTEARTTAAAMLAMGSRVSLQRLAAEIRGRG